MKGWFERRVPYKGRKVAVKHFFARMRVIPKKVTKKQWLYGDFDHDKIPNYLDCRPLDPKRHMDRSTINYLRSKGARIYLVGGKVRDDRLGKPSKDMDYLITGIPKDELESYLSKRGSVITDKNMGVFKFKDALSDQKGPDDIVLPRTEEPTGGGGHRDFRLTYDYTLPVEKDLERRDFTVNAMAVDAETGEIIDPFGGIQDLKKKRIRLVNPDAFKDDPLRMLRAGQFASRLDSELEPETKKAIKEMAPAIVKEPPERITEELRKGFGKGEHPEKMFDTLYDTGVLEKIIPETKEMKGFKQNKYHKYDLDKHTRETVKEVGRLSKDKSSEDRFKLTMAALLHDIGKPDSLVETKKGRQFIRHAEKSEEKAKQITKRLKMSNEEQQKIATLVRYHDAFQSGNISDKKIRQKISNLGEDTVRDLLILREADMIAHGASPSKVRKEIYHFKNRVEKNIKMTIPKENLAIKPKDLMTEFKIPPGAEIGEIQRAMHRSVISNPGLNTRKGLMQYIPKKYRG